MAMSTAMRVGLTATFCVGRRAQAVALHALLIGALGAAAMVLCGSSCAPALRVGRCGSPGRGSGCSGTGAGRRRSSLPRRPQHSVREGSRLNCRRFAAMAQRVGRGALLSVSLAHAMSLPRRPADQEPR
jgi:hypothetical protein